MGFSLRINMKMPTVVGIFIFISREIFTSALLSKKEFAIVSNFRFINRTLHFAASELGLHYLFLLSVPLFRVNTVLAAPSLSLALRGGTGRTSISV